MQKMLTMMLGLLTRILESVAFWAYHCNNLMPRLTSTCCCIRSHAETWRRCMQLRGSSTGRSCK
jgi:hypothetical protein